MHQKEFIIKWLSILSLVEGILALIFIFWIPSMDRNSTYFGYSLSRILTGIAFFIPLALLGWFCTRTFLDGNWLRDRITWMERVAFTGDRFLALISLLGYFFLFGSLSIIVFNSPISNTLGMITAVYRRLSSIIVWLMLISVQTGIALFLMVPGFWKMDEQDSFSSQKGLGKFPVFFHIWLVPSLILLSIFHWLVLYLHIYLFQLIPNWYWKYWIKEITPRDGLFVLVSIVAVGIVVFILKFPGKKWLNLGLLILLGYGLQVSFGFLDGNGFESIRLKFVKGGHNIYAQYASMQPDWWEAVTQYESIYGMKDFTDTKPPGVLLFHIVAEKIANRIDPVSDYKESYFRLTNFMSYTFPLVSVMVLALIFAFSKPYLDEGERFYPLILYIFLPNFLLMSLEIDQVFFPLLFMGGLLLWQKTLRNRSILWAGISGFYIYLTLFFTFSMLPVLPMLVLWTLIDQFFYQKDKRTRDSLWLLLALAAGVGLGYLVFYFGINYDFFLRYQNAFSRHHFHKNYESGLGYILNAVFLNTVEFAAWSGFAFFILFIVRTFRSLPALIKRHKGRMDGLVLSFAGMYGALNLFGQTRSEVGRLWLFLLPVIVILGADEAARLFQKKWVGILLLVFIQLVTVFLTFKFQDSINR